MRSFDPEILDLLDEGRIKIAGMIRFDFGEGSYGFIQRWSGYTYDGVDYEPLPEGIISISDLSSSLRWNTVTHVPASLSWRTTSMATPDPPATRTEMLSGSRSARAALARTAARATGLAARSCLDPARDLKERALEAVAAVESDGG